MENNYLVSVRLMTFNHEYFIKDAMDGIFMQQTDFNVEVVVGDDFSTDRTLQIIKEYKNTDRIHINILDRKDGDPYSESRKVLGRLYNLTDIMENCSGKYIAILDGDDFWTDPLKLQKQVTFLENNPEYSMCFHQALLLNENGQQSLFNNFPENKTFSIIDLINHNSVTTASVIFRNLFNYKHLSWFYELKAGDWAMNLIHADKGKVYYMNDCMSVYRIHSGGVWSGITVPEMAKKGIETLRQINEGFNFRYNEYFQKAIAERAKYFISPKSKFFSLKLILKRKIKRFLNILLVD